MYFIEYYTRDLAGNMEPVCGDRGVIILDGRLSADKYHDIAREEGKRRGFTFYKLCEGRSFLNVTRRTGLHYIT